MQHILIYSAVFVLGFIVGFILRSCFGTVSDNGNEWWDESDVGERTKTLYKRDTNKH